MKTIKTIFTLLFLLVISSAFAAEVVLPLDFEAGTYSWTDFDGGAVTIIDNAQKSGINTSEKVAQMIKSTGQQWGGSWIGLSSAIDFSQGKLFKMKVYSPKVGTKVLLKVENKDDSGKNFEIGVLTTKANEWEELEFDYSSINTANEYHNIVIIFDLGTMGDGSADFTYLFDDIALFSDGSASLEQINLPVSFDIETVNYTMTDFGGNTSSLVADPADATNTVAKTIKPASAEIWAGTTIGTASGFKDAAPFTETETFISVKVYSPSVGSVIRLKGESASDATLTAETEQTTTVANAWETLVFDLSDVAAGTNPFNIATAFNKFSIFFEFGTNGTESTYYWDDVVFGSDATALNTVKAMDALSVYPNPTTGTLNITATDGSLVRVYNVTGQLQKQEILHAGQVSLEELNAGIYFVNADNKISRVIKK